MEGKVKFKFGHARQLRQHAACSIPCEGLNGGERSTAKIHHVQACLPTLSPDTWLRMHARMQLPHKSLRGKFTVAAEAVVTAASEAAAVAAAGTASITGAPRWGFKAYAGWTYVLETGHLIA